MLQTEYIGLCKICANKAACVFTRDMIRPVIYCEEFQLEIAASAQSPLNENPQKAIQKHAEAQDKAQGLCCDCENRQTCGLVSNTEGGIWYCEEYR